MSTYQLKQRCERLVLHLVGHRNYYKWWNTPHIAFDRRSPNEQWLMDPETVFRFLVRQSNKFKS